MNPPPINNTLIYPGSFDPITLGHLDLLHRAVNLFDNVIVAVAEGPKKTLFSIEERIAMIEEVLKNEGLQSRVTTQGFNSLLVDFMRANNARFVLRGLRTVTDFEFEFQLANVNRRMYPQIETVFLMPDEGLAYISSSLVREIASLNGDLSQFVPATIAAALKKKFQ